MTVNRGDTWARNSWLVLLNPYHLWLIESSLNGLYPKSHVVLLPADVKSRTQLSFACITCRRLALLGWPVFMSCYLSFPQRLASSPDYPTSVVSLNTEAQDPSHFYSLDFITVPKQHSDNLSISLLWKCLSSAMLFYLSRAHRHN